MNLRIITSFLIMALLALGQFFSYPVLAEEYSISGNGEGSSGSINVNHENSTSIEQKNESEVKNEVKSDSNTGGNKASGNQDETNIETGDSSTEVVVENSGNTNTAEGGCCPSSGSNAQIIGNGVDSQNSITHTQNSNAQVSQNNNAKITNNINVNANTGENEALDNGGDVSIKTGYVKVAVGVLNKVNASYVSLPQQEGGLTSKIAGNGEGSENEIDQVYNDNQEFFVNNYLELNNNVKAYVNTGENKLSFSSNKAKGNIGKVLISTGNVYLDIILSNKANFSRIIADCGCKNAPPSPTPKPSETPTPSSPPSGGECCSPASPPSGGNSGGGSSSGGSSGGGGQVLGVTLPATGGFSLIQASLFALSLLGSGIMLKLDFKRARKYVKKVKREAIFNYFYQGAEVVGKRINFKLPLPVPRDLFTDFTYLPPLLFYSANFNIRTLNKYS